MTLTDWLAELERVENAASKGPWTHGPMNRRSSGEFIAASSKRIGVLDRDDKTFDDAHCVTQSRNALPKLLAIVRAQQEALEKLKNIKITDGCAECSNLWQNEYELGAAIEALANSDGERQLEAVREVLFQAETMGMLTAEMEKLRDAFGLSK